MYFIHIIHIVGGLLFSQIDELQANILTLKLWSSNINGRGMKTLLARNNDSAQQYSYVYEYNDVVNVECKTNNFLENSTLMWQIKKPTDHVSCTKKSTNALNYVTNLNETHKGNNLTCYIFNATGSLVDSAQVTFLCPKCKAKETKFDAKCYNNSKSAITTYINGEKKFDRYVQLSAKKKDVITVHCEIQPDDRLDILDFNPKDMSGSNFWYRFSDSVVVFRGIMGDSLDNQTISCLKLRDRKVITENTVSFKLISNHYITIGKSGSMWNTYRELTELLYGANDTVKLTCYWHHKDLVPTSLRWIRDGIEVNKTKNTANAVYEAILTEKDDGSNVTCENSISDTKDAKTISLRYVVPVENISDEKNDIAYTDDDTHNEGQTGNESKDVLWMVIGIIAIIVLVAILVLSIRKYKTWRASKMNEISYNNFQNTNTAPTLERPMLEPTYGAPVDDANMYAYTYNQKPTQETYTTPFVPTIEEMYTKPNKTKEKKDVTYATPGKFTYGNVQPSSQNQQEPGYSYASRDVGDDVSETYASSLYCRPR